MSEDKTYICIDLKSFFASVECAERGLDPMEANLVVADPSRTDRTICLAASPAIKKLGVPNRCRVYEIPKSINYIMAPPRMRLYLDYSERIYGIYLKYFSPEDIHVYSVDEAFIDITHYKKLYKMPPRRLAVCVLKDIKDTLRLYATCGIGTNLYLAKIALDIIAKRSEDFIGELTEESYRKTLWNHRPLDDFWMIGKGSVKKLSKVGIHTMGELAMADEHLIGRLFGVNAEFLLNHAWGRESTTIEDIKAYVPKSNSLSSSQVLPRDYSMDECLLITKEMCDLLSLKLVRRRKVTERISLSLSCSRAFEGARLSSSKTLPSRTNSNRVLTDAVCGLFFRLARKDIYYRKVSIAFECLKNEGFEQLDLFVDTEKIIKDRNIQRAVLSIKKRYGKNALMKGMDLEKAATTPERNAQIGGHRAG